MNTETYDTVDPEDRVYIGIAVEADWMAMTAYEAFAALNTDPLLRTAHQGESASQGIWVLKGDQRLSEWLGSFVDEERSLEYAAHDNFKHGVQTFQFCTFDPADEEMEDWMDFGIYERAGIGGDDINATVFVIHVENNTEQ